MFHKFEKSYKGDTRFKRYETLFRGRPKDFASTIWDYTNKYHAQFKVECTFLNGYYPSDFRPEDSPIWITLRLDKILFHIRAQFKSDGLSWLFSDVLLADIGGEAEKYWDNFLEYMSKHDYLVEMGTSTHGDKKNDANEPWMQIDENDYVKEAVKLLHEGLKIKDIAERVYLDPRTLNNEFSRLRKKYNTKNTKIIPYRKDVSKRKKGNS